LFRGCVLVDVGVKHRAAEAVRNPGPASMPYAALNC